jgi:mannose/fructose/sorbose-specific phosphotransferase system IIB component
MAIILLRIDDRLIHGQVVVGWSPHINATHIAVADDKIAQDITQRLLYEMVVPPDMKVSIFSLQEAADYFKSSQDDPFKTILLFSNPSDVVSYIKFGGPVKWVNIGGMRYQPGKLQISQCISLDENDKEAFRELAKAEIPLECRSVPSDNPVDMVQYL